MADPTPFDINMMNTPAAHWPSGEWVVASGSIELDGPISTVPLPPNYEQVLGIVSPGEWGPNPPAVTHVRNRTVGTGSIKTVRAAERLPGGSSWVNGFRPIEPGQIAGFRTEAVTGAVFDSSKTRSNVVDVRFLWFDGGGSSIGESPYSSEFSVLRDPVVISYSQVAPANAASFQVEMRVQRPSSRASEEVWFNRKMLVRADTQSKVNSLLSSFKYGESPGWVWLSGSTRNPPSSPGWSRLAPIPEGEVYHPLEGEVLEPIPEGGEFLEFEVSGETWEQTTLTGVVSVRTTRLHPGTGIFRDTVSVAATFDNGEGVGPGTWSVRIPVEQEPAPIIAYDLTEARLGDHYESLFPFWVRTTATALLPESGKLERSEEGFVPFQAIVNPEDTATLTLSNIPGAEDFGVTQTIEVPPLLEIPTAYEDPRFPYGGWRSPVVEFRLDGVPAGDYAFTLSSTSGGVQEGLVTVKPAGFDFGPNPEIRTVRPGLLGGSHDSISGYSVTEDLFPRNLADLSGGVSSLTADAVATEDSELLLHKEVTLHDPLFGSFLGDVTNVQVGQGLAEISADSPLRRAVTSRNLRPSRNTSGESIRDLLIEVGFEWEQVQLLSSNWILYELATPGGEVDVWEWLKQLGAVYGFEIVTSGEDVIVRDVLDLHRYQPPGGYLDQALPVIELDRDSYSRSLQEGDAARSVELTYYEPELFGRWESDPRYPDWTTLGMYPYGGWTPEVPILQVDAGETTEVDLTAPEDVIVSWGAVVQPECVTWVGRDPEYPWNSVYAVSGSDGLPIPPALWLDGGGSLTVRISEDTRTLVATLVGANLPELAPFQIAMSAGPSDRYSSLRLEGAGIGYRVKTLTLPTGVSDQKVSSEQAPSIDSMAVQSLERAYEEGVKAAGWHSGRVMEVSGFSPKLVESDAFGNLVGKRFRNSRRAWVITSATTTPSGHEFTAREDTRFREFQGGLSNRDEAGHVGAWDRQTFAEFNSEYTGLSFSEFSTRPLRRDDALQPPPLFDRWEVALNNPSFEQSLKGWETVGEEYMTPVGDLSRVRLQDAFPEGVPEEFSGMGEWAASYTRPSSMSAGGVQEDRPDISRGAWIGVRASVAVHGVAFLDLGLRMSWLDEDGTEVSASDFFTEVELGTPQVLSAAWQVPAEAVYCRLSINMEQYGMWDDLGGFVVDGIMKVPGGSEEEVLQRLDTYLDGDTPDTLERVTFWGDGFNDSRFPYHYLRENSFTGVRELGE